MPTCTERALAPVSLERFITVSRAEMAFAGKELVRRLYRSEISRVIDVGVLEGYMADRIPTYYRAPELLATDLRLRLWVSSSCTASARCSSWREDDDRPMPQHFGVRQLRDPRCHDLRALLAL